MHVRQTRLSWQRTLLQKSSWPMTSRTVLLPAAMPPPSSSRTGPRSALTLMPLPARLSSEKISYSVWNLRKAVESSQGAAAEAGQDLGQSTIDWCSCHM